MPNDDTSWTPAALTFVSLWFSFILPAAFVLVLALAPGATVSPIWLTPVAAGTAWAVTLAARTPFKWKPRNMHDPRGLILGAVASLGSYFLLRSGVEGRFAVAVLMAALAGYMGGLGLARARGLAQQRSRPNNLNGAE